MNRLFLILIIGTTLFSCSRRTKTEIKDIDNVKTDKHINIPGTRLFIVPPADFKIATSFIGLQKDDNTIVQIYDYSDANYYTYATDFNKEEFEKSGAKVFEYKEFKVNNYPAKYIFMQNNANQNAISLLFGDSTFLTIIEADYPSLDSGDEIQQLINTIYYDKNIKINDSFFVLDDRKSIFKFSKTADGNLMYYVGGGDKRLNNNEPFIFVSRPIKQKFSLEDVSKNGISFLEEYYGLTDVRLDNVSTENVNGLPAYEVNVYGKMQEGGNILIYQLTIYAKDKYFSIRGIAKSDFDNNLREFKNLARTIKLK